MEELSEKARRILGDSWIDGTIQTDLHTALDMIVKLRTRAVPAVSWDDCTAWAGGLLLTVHEERGLCHWTIARGNGMDDDIDCGKSSTLAKAKSDCEDALLRLVGCKC